MKKPIFRFFLLFFLIASCYIAGRLYFHFTGGFSLANITSNFTYQPQWEMRSLEKEEELLVQNAIAQPYYYLAKGCQSYVFISQDRRYVIKFFKHQRHRLQPWLEYFPPLPSVVKYKAEKQQKKWEKLNYFFESWKLTFEKLKEESALLFVHLNKSSFLHTQLSIYDKIGRHYQIDLDQTEFCLQHVVKPLDETLLEYKQKAQHSKAKELIHRLLTLTLSEYSRGLADNDHALIQNTGVLNGYPIHVDIGQFVENEEIKNPAIFHQELFTKTFRLKLWLQKHYVETAEYLEQELIQIIGPAYLTMQPKFREK